MRRAFPARLRASFVSRDEPYARRVSEQRRKPGPAPRISRAAVLDAALRLPADRLTMTAISEELGVTAGALYRYFPDRAAVVEALVTQTQELLECPDPSLPWREWLSALAHAERDLWSGRPDLAQERGAALASSVVEVTTTGTTVLMNAGFERNDAIIALVAMSSVARITALLDPTLGTNRAFGEHKDAVVEAFGEEMLGGLRAQDSDTIFEQVLAVTLDGLEVRRTRKRTAP